MRKLIIGCGYLGARVANVWVHEGHDVSVLTRSSAHADRFRSLGMRPFVGDVTVTKSLEQLPVADTVLYAVGFDRNAPASKREVYVDGLTNVLHVLGSRAARFLYISSTSVYGQMSGEWVDEESPCEPSGENGRICLDAEQAVWRAFAAAGQQRGCAANILRLAGIYGPGRLLARVESLQKGEPLAGNPRSWLNLVHVDDAVAAVLACEARGRAGGTYIVCDNRPIPRWEYYETLAEFIGAPFPEFADVEEAGDQSHDLNKRCSNHKLRDELRWSPKFPEFLMGLTDALTSPP